MFSRPLNENERRERACSVVHTPTSREVGVRDKSFTFYKVFGVESTQPDVNKSVVSPLVHQVLQGYNCTVFAYGQTGTGKTHTMEGPPDDCFANGVPVCYTNWSMPQTFYRVDRAIQVGRAGQGRASFLA